MSCEDSSSISSTSESEKEVSKSSDNSENYNRALELELKNHERSLNTYESIGELICSSENKCEQFRIKNDPILLSKLTSKDEKFDE